MPAEQRSIPYIGQAYRPDAWIRYYTGLPAGALGDREQLDALADRHPDDITVVLGWCEPTDPAVALCEQIVGPGPQHPPRPRVGPAAEISATG